MQSTNLSVRKLPSHDLVRCHYHITRWTCVYNKINIIEQTVMPIKKYTVYKPKSCVVTQRSPQKLKDNVPVAIAMNSIGLILVNPSMSIFTRNENL